MVAGVGISDVNSVVVESFLMDQHARDRSLQRRAGVVDQLLGFARPPATAFAADHAIVGEMGTRIALTEDATD